MFYLIVIVPLLRPVEAGGSECFRVRDKQHFDLELDADLTGNGELCAGAGAGITGREEQEVHIRADIAVDAELERNERHIKAKTCERLDRDAQRRVEEHGANLVLVAEGDLQVGMESGLKGDKHGNSAAEVGLTPLILTFHIRTDVASAEGNIPLAVLNADTGFQNDGSVEVEGHGAFAVRVAVLLIVGLLKLLLELADILIQVVGIVIDVDIIAAVDRVFVLAGAFADKNDNSEGCRILRGKDHHIQRGIPCFAGELAQEHKAVADHIVDVDLLEDRADVNRIHDIVANLVADLRRSAVAGRKIRLVGDVRDAEGHAHSPDGHTAAGDDCLDVGGRSGIAALVCNTVCLQVVVRHRIDAAQDRDRGEREHKQARVFQPVQVYDLSRRQVFTGQICLSGELLALGGVESKSDNVFTAIGGIAVVARAYRLAAERNVGIQDRLAEAGRNAQILCIINNVACVIGGSVALVILLIILPNDLRRGRAASDGLEIYDGIAGFSSFEIQHSISGLIAVDAVLKDVADIIGSFQRFVRLRVLELRCIEPNRSLSVDRIDRDIGSAVLSGDLIDGGLNKRVRAINAVFIDACADGDSTAVRLAVRLEEGQRCTGDGSHDIIVAGVSLQRGDVLLTADKPVCGNGADVGLAVLLGHRVDCSANAVRLIDDEFTLAVRRQIPFHAISVFIIHRSLGFGIELENVQLIGECVDRYIHGGALAGLCVGGCHGDRSFARVAGTNKQKIA